MQYKTDKERKNLFREISCIYMLPAVQRKFAGHMLGFSMGACLGGGW
jgi:hypothetical protein